MKVEGWVMTDRVGSKATFPVTIDDEDVEGLSEAQRDKIIEETVYEQMTQHLDWGWNVIG